MLSDAKLLTMSEFGSDRIRFLVLGVIGRFVGGASMTHSPPTTASKSSLPKVSVSSPSASVRWRTCGHLVSHHCRKHGCTGV